MEILIILFLATCFLAYSNGANDNFKGVATLFGSRTINYKGAIWLATVTTFAGSVGSIFFAQTLVKTFSGKGLVPDAVSISPEFLTAVAFGIGLASKRLNTGIMQGIILSWLVTLPIAAVFSAGAYWILVWFAH